MKKVLFILLCVSALIFAIRNIYASKQPEHVNNIDYVVDHAIEQNEECSHFWNAKTFINNDILRVGINDNWNIEYNILANGRWYHIDERGNLNSDCSFSEVPVIVEITDDENWYNVNYYGSEKDKSNYKNFTKKNFSEIWYKDRQDRQRNNIKPKVVHTLSLAEDYFWIKLYQDKRLDCDFCDTERFYYDTITNKSWDIIDMYGVEPLNKKYIVFNSGWTVQILGIENPQKYEWYFGKDKSTILIKNDNTGQSIQRLVINKQKDDEIRFIKEIIQVYQ